MVVRLQTVFRAIVPWLGVLFVVSAMMIVAMMMSTKVIIFPEIAALAVGSLVYNEERWVQRRFFLWFLPSLSALIGVTINHTGLPFWLKELSALFIVLALLQGFRAQVAPSISAAILPIVLGVQSWLFVLSVTILTIVVVFLHKMTKEVPPIRHEGVRDRMTLIAYSVVCALWIVLTSVLPFHVKVIPPLLVVFYEMMPQRDLTFLSYLKRGFYLSLIASVGVFVATLCGGNIVATGVIDVLLTFLIARLLNLRVPPAFAIALLPIIFQGTGGSYILIVVVTMLFLLISQQSIRLLQGKWRG